MSNAIEKAPLVRCRALIAVFALWCVGGLPTPPAVAQEQTPSPFVEPPLVEPLTEPMAVIPPGREELLAEMLGRGAALPGECAFTSGQVESDVVTATYTCPAGAVVFTLRHPDKASSDATLTEKFGIAVKSGTPPAGLTDDLASRIRAREQAFEWTWVGSYAERQSPRVLVAIAILAGAVLWLVLRRRRRQA